MANPSLSLVSAVYNNAATLADLHREVVAVVAPLVPDFELILVDDCSPDGAWEAMQELAAMDPRVVPLGHRHNAGQHEALLTGLRHARGEWAVTLDADLQDPPEAIARLWTARQTAAAVFAGRRGHYESTGRLLTSRLYKTAMSTLSGLPPDAGAFVLINRSLIDRLLRLRIRHANLLGMIACTGSRMTSIPVVRRERASGDSSYTSRTRLRAAWRGLRLALAARLREPRYEVQPACRVPLRTTSS